MFIEPFKSNSTAGWIEVICGSMFSGKTEELIRRLKRAQIANQHVEIFKPAVDIPGTMKPMSYRMMRNAYGPRRLQLPRISYCLPKTLP